MRSAMTKDSTEIPPRAGVHPSEEESKTEEDHPRQAQTQL
ncbi:hypothetical protein PF003_g14153 [Phytophthora fragariae]|nr:hypothetical protein PF003_g14153 [Phytophthora fragariae]